MFFDERFNYISDGSTNLRAVNANNNAAPLVLANIKAPKNGYAYVYVSNESDDAVFFDNLQVSHNRGRIIEENHYYAYGLKIAGISSHKLADTNEGHVDNKNLYNDKELDDEGDLNWLDYGFRNYDPQIGRFVEIDPLAGFYISLSPYSYGGNDPITNVDEDGLSLAQPLTKAASGIQQLQEVVVTTVRHITKAPSALSVTGNFLKGVGRSLIGTVKGVANAVVHPIQTTKALGHVIAHPIQTANAITNVAKNAYKEFQNGNADKKADMLGEAVGDIAQLFIGTEEIKAATELLTLTKEAEGIGKIGEAATVYERVMSEAELKATKGNDLLRGGREGENFFSKEGTISNDAKRAQQRLGLDGELRTHKVKFTIDDPGVTITGPRRAKAGKSGTSGGGREFSTKEATKIKIKEVIKLKNTIE